MLDTCLPAPSPRAELHETMPAFTGEQVLPAEAEHRAHRAGGGPVVPPVVERLEEQARAVGRRSLFLPPESGLAQLEHAPLAELSGRSNDLASEPIGSTAELGRSPLLPPG